MNGDECLRLILDYPTLSPSTHSPLVVSSRGVFRFKSKATLPKSKHGTLHAINVPRSFGFHVFVRISC